MINNLEFSVWWISFIKLFLVLVILGLFGFNLVLYILRVR